MIREIVKYGDEILRTDCEIALDNKETHKHIKDLKETLLNIENGAGLAAPQLGINSRIFVTRNYKDDKREEILTFINPKITKKSKECLLISDGCLSIPNVFSKTKRNINNKKRLVYELKRSNFLLSNRRNSIIINFF